MTKDIVEIADGLIGNTMILLEIQKKMKTPVDWFTILACLKEKKMTGETLWLKVKSHEGDINSLLDEFVKKGWIKSYVK